MAAAPDKSTKKAATPRAPRTSTVPADEQRLMIAPQGETAQAKSDRLAKLRSLRLLRLAESRMTKVLKGIAGLGNLATYKPTSEQVDEIMSALGSTCAAVEARLRGARVETATFSLRRIK